MESAYCMNTRLAAMPSMISFTLPNASLSTLDRGPCNMEHSAVMISAFSTPNQGNLERFIQFMLSRVRCEVERTNKYGHGNEKKR